MPEEKKRFTVRPGARVEVGIAGDPAEAERPTLPPDATAPGVSHVDTEDDPLQRRARKGALTFFDAATRLRSVPAATAFSDYTRTRAPEPPPEANDSAGNFNEYLEIAVDAPAENLRRLIRPPYDSHVPDDYGFGTQHVNADVPASVQHAFDAALLGSLAEGSADPVSPLDKFKANGSGRELPACAPVPYVPTVADREHYHEADGYPTEAFDFTLYNDDKTLRFPNTTFRESVEDLRTWANDDPADPDSDIDVQAVFNGMDFLQNEKWKEREHKADEASERWNPDNLTGGEAKRAAEHDQKGQGGGFNLKVESRLIYEPFDTGDRLNFKVTKEPSFDADEVSLKLSGRPSRVFLRPQLLVFGRAERYDRGLFSAVETHTWRDADGQTPWVHHRTENFQTDYSGGAFLDLTLFNVYDPSATPQTFTVTATKIPSAFGFIKATVSGTPAGDGDYEWPEGASMEFHAATGIEISMFFESSIPNGKFVSVDVVPAWTIYQIFYSATCDLFRGAHVARWPTLPRAGVGGWDSMLTFAGENGYEYTDAFNGVHYVYDPAVSAALPGRTAFHDGDPAKMRQVYDRHASRDTQRLAYLPGVLSARAFFFDHPELGISEATLKAIRGSHFVGGLFADAATADALDAQVEADAQEVAAAVAALGTQFRNPVGGLLPATAVISQRERIEMFPPYTVPAGTLAGIVEHGSAAFYVWRKTPETRGGYDGERNQGSARYPFIFPYS